MKVAVLGAGFWSRYQIAGWKEIAGVEVVGICDSDPARAAEASALHRVPAFGDLDSMLRAGQPDVVDVITPPATHAGIVLDLKKRGMPVICQKPMANSREEAVAMVEYRPEVPFFVHENWRFQAPLQRAKLWLPRIGVPFRARLQFSCSFPVFDNQPFLRALDRFILMDIGPHVLDAARFLFGEAKTLTAWTSKVNPGIRGEDVATVVMEMDGCAVVICEMSYASRLRDEAFPETYLVVEGAQGSLEIRKGHRVTLTTAEGEAVDEFAHPTSYPWVEPAYRLVQSSIVDCQRAILDDLRGIADSGLRGSQNLRTMELVFASYEAADARSNL